MIQNKDVQRNVFVHRLQTLSSLKHNILNVCQTYTMQHYTAEYYQKVRLPYIELHKTLVFIISIYCTNIKW